MSKRLSPLEYVQVVEEKSAKYLGDPTFVKHSRILRQILTNYLEHNKTQIWGEFRVRLEKVLTTLDVDIIENHKDTRSSSNSLPPKN